MEAPQFRRVACSCVSHVLYKACLVPTWADLSICTAKLFVLRNKAAELDLFDLEFNLLAEASNSRSE